MEQIHLPSAGITNAHHHVWLLLFPQESELQSSCFQSGHLANWTTSPAWTCVLKYGSIPVKWSCPAGTCPTSEHAMTALFLFPHPSGNSSVLGRLLIIKDEESKLKLTCLVECKTTGNENWENVQWVKGLPHKQRTWVWNPRAHTKIEQHSLNLQCQHSCA